MEDELERIPFLEPDEPDSQDDEDPRDDGRPCDHCGMICCDGVCETVLGYNTP